jgi:hypothetical protein
VKWRGVVVMNSRLSALISAGSRTVAKSEETGPAHRWASSAITKSNVGTRPSVYDFAICGLDDSSYYVR